MKANNQSMERKNWIDGQKAIACIIIMIGHYCETLRYSADIRINSLVITKMMRLFPFNFLSDEVCWLHLFFVLSGLVISMSSHNKIKKISEIIENCFKRFLRFLFPVFGAEIIFFYNKVDSISFGRSWKRFFK